jgi:glycerol-3-phosphate dehydrogenase
MIFLTKSSDMKKFSQLDPPHAPPIFDIAIVGGGATGLGVALDASLRGLSVVLFELNDFASGTSSRSTKLLHGGVRYLAQGNISLVREALAERKTIMHIAPHLAQPLAFVMPAYSFWEKMTYGAGLKLYDVLAGHQGLGQTKVLNFAQTQAALPGVRAEHLNGGVLYWDGQFDDARLALTLARSAQDAGAKVFNHCRVQAITPIRHQTSQAIQSAQVLPPPNAARFTLQLQDVFSGDKREVAARCVVNAAGVWVDGIRHMAGIDSTRRIVSPSQGVHLVVSRELLPTDRALLVPKTDDGRVLFAVPWLGSTILGTTDTPRKDAPHEPLPFDHEVEFILGQASKILSRPVTRQDVKSVWVGLRPLVTPEKSNGGTKSISREHTIVVDESGLITVTGGKWTTYRVMADDVLKAATSHGLIKNSVPCATASMRLHGAPTNQTVSMTQAPGEHLFGTDIERIRLIDGFDQPLGLGLNEAMVRFSAREEFAVTVEDMLARRWRALFLDARQALQMAPRVAAILESETGLDPKLDDFERLCHQYQLMP